MLFFIIQRRRQKLRDRVSIYSLCNTNPKCVCVFCQNVQVLAEIRGVLNSISPSTKRPLVLSATWDKATIYKRRFEGGCTKYRDESLGWYICQGINFHFLHYQYQ